MRGCNNEKNINKHKYVFIRTSCLYKLYNVRFALMVYSRGCNLMPNKLIEKIRSYLKEIDLESLQHKYQEPSTNDDFIQYEPLPQIYIDSLDDSNKEKMLQKIADRNGF